MYEKQPTDDPDDDGNVADEVRSVWIGGPLDGWEQSQPRADAENCLGKEVICGGNMHRAIYRFDATIDDQRLPLRFVRLA